MFPYSVANTTRQSRSVSGIERRSKRRRSKSASRPSVPVIQPLRQSSERFRESANGLNAYPVSVTKPRKSEQGEPKKSKKKRTYSWLHIREDPPVSEMKTKNVSKKATKKSLKRTSPSPGVDSLRFSLMDPDSENSLDPKDSEEPPQHVEKSNKSIPPTLSPEVGKRSPYATSVGEKEKGGPSLLSKDSHVRNQRGNCMGHETNNYGFCGALSNWFCWLCCPLVPYNETD